MVLINTNKSISLEEAGLIADQVATQEIKADTEGFGSLVKPDKPKNASRFWSYKTNQRIDYLNEDFDNPFED